MMEIAKRVTYNQAVGIFGFTGEDHIGKVSFPPVQVRSISSPPRMCVSVYISTILTFGFIVAVDLLF